MKEIMITPFVKWAGGKTQILEKLKANMPDDYGTYFEPFIGGGALLFNLQPKKASINDYNNQLINAYYQIEDSPLGLIQTMRKIQNKYNKLNDNDEKKDYYYKLREQYNEYVRHPEKDCESIETAALFIILNKLGFNGLYRVNAKGEFNVPWNQQDKLNAYSEENIYAINDYLKNVDVSCGDFEIAVKTAKKNDFVYFDPPYDSDLETFTDYTKVGFGKNEQIRLSECYKSLDKKGVKCMLSNHNTKLINELYKNYNIHIIEARRSINSKGNGRGKVQEVIITNY